MAWKYVLKNRKVGLPICSTNLVFSFIGVHQAKTFGCACSKHKWPVMKLASYKITVLISLALSLEYHNSMTGYRNAPNVHP